MSLAPEINNPALNNLIQSSLESEHDLRLEWFLYTDIVKIDSTQFDNVYGAFSFNNVIVVVLVLVSSGECTPTLVSEFARLYSLPTNKYNNDVSQFRRYSTWLSRRNSM